ncbi:MAG: hypothetical protein E6H77_11780 [Betaproteobacteria bacterium]|nr:MAG: hypothetical protein E6H77_11780 [Betaproteobacteria bacterium]
MEVLAREVGEHGQQRTALAAQMRAEGLEPGLVSAEFPHQLEPGLVSAEFPHQLEPLALGTVQGAVLGGEVKDVARGHG